MLGLSILDNINTTQHFLECTSPMDIIMKFHKRKNINTSAKLTS